MPHYRLGIVNALLRHKDIISHFLFSIEDPRDIKKINIDSFEKRHLKRFIFVKNLWFKKKVLFWQKNVLKNVLLSDYNSVVFLGEMYIISTWIGVLIARLRDKKVVFWGHGLYGNESFIKKIIRKSFLKLPHLNLVYDNHAKNIMIVEGFKPSKIDIIYNSIETIKFDNSKYNNELKYDFFSNNNLPSLVFVGRLTKVKKLDFLIEAILILNKEKPSFNLLIVGAGKEEDGLKILAKKGTREEFPYLNPDQYAAQGGRIGYQDGRSVRSIALNQLYGIAPKRKMAQEGGLMDLGGMEKDYREEGGFVPIGGQERADDVPARLSKNEFVFTADAVRAAGGGDIDAGAEVMENVMNNLEQGGNISEESQGLEGARDMFATSQRLEGVM